MKLTQKLGINFANTFDKSLFLYTSLKGLHILYRYSFYILLVLALYFTITKVEEVINIRSYEYIPIYIQNLLIVIGLLIKFFAVLFTMGIFAYESIYNIDLDKYLEELKNKKQFIKDNKLEKWRLRNMNIFFRVLFYIGLWCFLYLLLEDILISAFFDIYGHNPSKEIYIKFLIDYDLTIKYFTGIYLITIMILDFFVRKNRRLIKKFPAETLTKE